MFALSRPVYSPRLMLGLILSFLVLFSAKVSYAWDCCYYKFDCLDDYICFVYCNGPEEDSCLIIVRDVGGGYDVAPAGCDFLGFCFTNYGLNCPTILTGTCNYIWVPDPFDPDCDFETINACLDPYDLCELGQNSINCTYPGGVCCP